jgi:hypothetical protein
MAKDMGGKADSGSGGGDERIAHKPPYQPPTDGERRQAVRRLVCRCDPLGTHRCEDRVDAVLSGATFTVAVAS